MIQIVVLTCLAALTLGDAQPLGYLHAVPALYNSYPNWPGVSGLGFSSTCYGCYGRKKRSAEPHYGYVYPLLHHHVVPLGKPGVDGHPGGGTSYVAGGNTGIGKRSADPHYGYVYPLLHHHVPLPVLKPGVAGHPGGATSYVAGSGPGIGKRSADADPHGVYVPYLLPAYSVRGVSQLHPDGGHSFQHVAIGK